MYIFQDCEFEIGKPIFVMCSAFCPYSRPSDDDFFLFKTDKVICEYDVFKVKRGRVTEIRFNGDDPREATSITLHNGITLFRNSHCLIGHSVQEVKKKFDELRQERNNE